MKKCIDLWCCAFLLCLVAIERAPAQGIRIYEPATAWDHPELASPSSENLLFTDPVTNHYCARSYYYTGLSRDGCIYVIQVFHWRYAWFDGWGIVIVASDSSGHSFVHEGRIRERDVTESKEAVSIRFGDSLVENKGPTTRILLDLDGFRCDLTMRSLLSPWTPGDGYAMLVASGDIYMRKAVPTPLAETSGSLQIGATTISADGWSYGDRSLTVAPPGKLDFSGCAFRVFSERCSGDEEPWNLALLEYASVGRQEGLRIPMLLMAHGSEWIITSREYQVTFEDPIHDAATSLSYPSRMHLSARSRGYTLEGDYRVDRLIATSEVLEHLPGLFRGVASVLMKQPILYRMVGHFIGTIVKPDGSVENLVLAGQGEYFTVR